MVNASKKRDPRFWRKWRDSGAVLFNQQCHPELRPGEVWVTNVGRHDNGSWCGWITKRLGRVAYSRSGRILKGSRPIFALKNELDLAGARDPDSIFAKLALIVQSRGEVPMKAVINTGGYGVSEGYAVQITLPNGKYHYTGIGSILAHNAKKLGMPCKIVHYFGACIYANINDRAHDRFPIQIDGVSVAEFVEKIAKEGDRHQFFPIT